MRKHWTRLLSGFLCLVMVLTLLPTQVHAVRTEQTEQQTLHFLDVKSSDWFYDAVRYANANGFFNGTSTTTFSPNDTMTRGMFVTVLGRMAGIDPADYAETVKFADVPKNAWYAPYVAWAMKYGITSGTSATTFAPDAPVTRQEMAVFFVRYFELFGVTYETGAKITTTPADIAAVAAWAQDAVLKLWTQELLNGDGKNFDPKGSATRAQVATLCMRTDKAVGTWYSEPGIPSERVSVDPNASQQPEEDKKPSSGSSSSSSYKITLNMPDGSIATLTQTSSTLNLDGLSTPKQDGYYFLGWYYDEACTRQAMDGDTLTPAVSLYPKMLKSGEIETSDTPYYTVSTDVNTDFTITVKSTSDKDLTSMITLSGPEQYVNDTSDDTAILSVKNNGDGTYTISGPGGELAAGGSYRVMLEDDTLTFDGQAASIREYHFTVKTGAPVMNLHLKDSVKEISISDISNAAQISAQSLSPVSLYAGSETAADTGVSDTTGTFIYSGNEELKVGDTLAIYEGNTKPDDRTATSNDLGDVSYVTITGKTGTNTYSYEAATTEDVLFTPDVLPIQSDWDLVATDGKKLTISADNLATAMDDVDAESLDEGDFLAFYIGDSMEDATSVTYGCVTGFSKESDGSYIIVYTDTTEENVLSSMDVTTQNDVSGDELLAGADIDALEDDIAQQAVDSGFAQAVAQNIATAVSTMDPSELEDGELDLSGIDLSGLTDQDLSFGTLQSASVATYADAGAGGGSSGPEVEVKVKEVKISKNLEHFSGMSGVRIALTLEVTIEFDAGEEGENITITFTPTFVQELRLSISTKGGIKWKWKWIFPYIYDFYARVSVDMYAYTSINLNATITSGGEEDTVTKVQNLVDKLKGGDEVAEGISDLQDLYSAMLENDSEWITLYRKNINEQKWTVAKIINITLSIDFVVQANVNISLGLEFEYENAKRYVYNIYIFHGKTTSDTIDLVTENYTLQLYAMGVLGIRAGVETCLSVDVITKKVAAVGVVVSVGAYLKVYGYVVYKLEHVAGRPNTSNGSGALYAEVGCYLDIGMDISAFNGKLSWKPTLYSKEWPLWSAGSILSVSGFAAAQQDEDDEDAEDVEIPIAYMRRGQTAINVPSELLTMAGFDMRTGTDAEKTYDISMFDFSFSDSRFSLKNGQITLDFGDGVTWQTYPDRELECDMTITWKGAPLSFNTETMQLKTKVHWDQYNDYCTAIFDVQGANKKIANMKLESAGTLTLPALTDADRPGYIFLGWKVERVQADGTLVTYATALKDGSIPVEGYDLRLTAQWEAKTDIAYTIIPRLQQPGGTYVYVYGEPYTQHDGRVDTYIIPTLEDIPGYVTPGVGGYYINADGSTEIVVSYTRRSCTLLVEDLGVIKGLTYRYGDKFSITPPTREGYTFDGWKVEKIEYNEDGMPVYTEMDTMPTTMPTHDMKLTAQWIPNEHTPYTVNIWKEKEDGSYELAETLENTFGTSGTLAKPGTDFTLPTYDYYTMRDDCKNLSVTIAGNGKAIGDYYYDLNVGTLTIGHMVDGQMTTEIVQCKGALPASTQSFPGYELEGYYDDTDYAEATTYPSTLTTFRIIYAKWIPRTDTAYTIEMYLEGETAYSFPETATETRNGTGTTGDWVEAKDAPEQTGYDVRDFDAIQIKGDGSTVAKFKYYRKSYDLTLHTNGGTGVSNSSVRYGTKVAPGTPERAGYTFGGWYTDSSCTTELGTNVTMPANDLALYAKWTANIDTTYAVEYYYQEADGQNYTQDTTLTQNATGTTDTTIALDSFKSIGAKIGFTFNETKSTTGATIAGNGKTVVKVYYDRQTFPLHYELNDTNATLNGSDGTYRHGATVTTPVPTTTRAGYTFEGWFTDKAFTTAFTGTMPMADTTLYAKWVAGNTSYTVKHYLQKLDGSYPDSPETSTVGSGNVDATVTPTFKTYEGFTAPTAQTITLSATDSDNVVSYYYARNSYTLTWDARNGEAADTSSVKFGASVNKPTTDPTRTGYTFKGWYTDANCTQALGDSFTMPAYGQTLYAKWEPITYTLRFKVDGNVPLETWLLNTKTGTEKTWPSEDEGDWALPYIDIPVEYDEVFTLPGENINSGATGFSYIVTNEDGSGNMVTLFLGGTIKNVSTDQDDVITVSATWPSQESSTSTIKIYTASQLFSIMSNMGNGDYTNTTIELAADLDCGSCGAMISGTNTKADNGVIFDGKNHTIKNLKRTQSNTGLLGGLFFGLGDDSTVKNLTIDGMTIDCDASGAMYYGAYGGLFGYVGKGFTMENVAVKNVSMGLTLGATDSYSFNQATRINEKDCVGGLIGYAAGSVTLTNCSIEDLTITTTEGDGVPDPVVGNLIGYVDALDKATFDTVNGGYTWTFANATVTLTGCTVTNAGIQERIGGTYTGTEDTDPKVTVTDIEESGTAVANYFLLPDPEDGDVKSAA